MRTVRNLPDLQRTLQKAFEKRRPITISYLEVAKDENGRRLWDVAEDGTRTERLAETVRTIEIFAFRATGKGIVYVAMDRESGEPRNWCLHRIRRYTVHHSSSYTVPVPEDWAETVEEQAKLLAVGTVEEYVALELERDTDAPPVEDPDDMIPLPDTALVA